MRWINFSDRLPTRNDADEFGNVELLETNGSSRDGLWDWIRPDRRDAVDVWHANGFAAWRRILRASTAREDRG